MSGHMDIEEFLRMQRELQIGMKEANPNLTTGDPYLMNEEELAQFITWNHTALILELSEMMQEVGWKPWASSRHVNYPHALHEMVDAWHFWLNIMLGLGAMAQCPIKVLMIDFETYYQTKNARNLQRQVEGYDGISSKCPACKGEMSETGCTPTVCTKKGEGVKKVDKELEELQANIERRSGEGKSTSSEELTAAARQVHREAQEAAGYAPIAPDPDFLDPATMFKGGERGSKDSRILESTSATGEPIFIFRAKDIFSVMVLSFYAEIIEKYGPDDTEFHRDVVDALAGFKEWQRTHVAQVRYPD